MVGCAPGRPLLDASGYCCRLWTIRRKKPGHGEADDEKPASLVAPNKTASDEESGKTLEQEESEEETIEEEKPEIKPQQISFPTTNQTRHCFTRYIEYHRCIAAKGDDISECNKFAKYYRALCLMNGLSVGMNKERMELSLVPYKTISCFSSRHDEPVQ
ncbi:hypothetical protein HPP92_009130 [Vanilla planifolia]|uniref:Uncharacterized protein n=1 Tax=Vanilla planifolia TaxID=51239 RepID=A0A835RFA0_VANPL|nr:hypothetical protein HPP92_009130 [Vanilla planifolia]